MLIEEKIIDIIKENLPELEEVTGSGIYNIYPGFIPDSVLPNTAIVYSLINQTIQFTQKCSTFQIGVYSKSYREGKLIADKIVDIFNSKTYLNEGNLISSKINIVLDLSYQAQSKLYLVAIDIFVKSKI